MVTHFVIHLSMDHLAKIFFEINEGVCEEENYFGVKLKHLVMNFSSDWLFCHKKFKFEFNLLEIVKKIFLNQPWNEKVFLKT